ncbi:hypothetical protein [Chamaesiphon sp. VAR_48_metabat_403]|uniref:hypothetical protein n=1 Tax=Chamaesiphon sp. VAR_48_metabat_403 TaxID=2964700 RepID=UPI00286E2AE9|nr:hypothetical protein [Chamaesiphon sp. VAR_48_metabat_403]
MLTIHQRCYAGASSGGATDLFTGTIQSLAKPLCKRIERLYYLRDRHKVYSRSVTN